VGADEGAVDDVRVGGVHGAGRFPERHSVDRDREEPAGPPHDRPEGSADGEADRHPHDEQGPPWEREPCDGAKRRDADGVCRVRAEDGAACSDDGSCASGHCVGAAGTATCCATACLGEQRCLKAFKDEDRDGFGSRVGAATFRCEGEIGKDPNGTPRPFATSSDDCDDTDFRAFPGQTTFFDAPAKGGGFDFNCDGTQTPQYRVNSSKNLRCGICRCDTGAEVMACLTAPPAFPVGGAIIEGGTCKCETADAARTFVTPPLTGLCGVAPQSATLCQSRISYVTGMCPSVVSTGPQGNIACR
jgi:hypothetical protein